MVKLWFLMSLEPVVVNTLSLVKSEGEMEANVGVDIKRKVKWTYPSLSDLNSQIPIRLSTLDRKRIGLERMGQR